VITHTLPASLPAMSPQPSAVAKYTFLTSV
jgi:hypothetical protein